MDMDFKSSVYGLPRTYFEFWYWDGFYWPLGWFCHTDLATLVCVETERGGTLWRLALASPGPCLFSLREDMFLLPSCFHWTVYTRPRVPNSSRKTRKQIQVAFFWISEEMWRHNEMDSNLEWHIETQTLEVNKRNGGKKHMLINDPVWMKLSLLPPQCGSTPVIKTGLLTSVEWLSCPSGSHQSRDACLASAICSVSQNALLLPLKWGMTGSSVEEPPAVKTCSVCPSISIQMTSNSVQKEIRTSQRNDIMLMGWRHFSSLFHPSAQTQKCSNENVKYISERFVMGNVQFWKCVFNSKSAASSQIKKQKAFCLIQTIVYYLHTYMLFMRCWLLNRDRKSGRTYSEGLNYRSPKISKIFFL